MQRHGVRGASATGESQSVAGMQGGIADPATVGVSWVPTGAVDLDVFGQPWWTMHPKIDDARTAQKFAALGRPKGAPGDSPIFRIIIRLENAVCAALRT